MTRIVSWTPICSCLYELIVLHIGRNDKHALYADCISRSIGYCTCLVQRHLAVLDVKDDDLPKQRCDHLQYPVTLLGNRDYLGTEPHIEISSLHKLVPLLDSEELAEWHPGSAPSVKFSS